MSELKSVREALTRLKAKDEHSFLEKLRLKSGTMFYYRVRHMMILAAMEYKKGLSDEEKVRFDKFWGTGS